MVHGTLTCGHPSCCIAWGFSSHWNSQLTIPGMVPIICKPQTMHQCSSSFGGHQLLSWFAFPVTYLLLVFGLCIPNELVTHQENPILSQEPYHSIVTPFSKTLNSLGPHGLFCWLLSGSRCNVCGLPILWDPENHSSVTGLVNKAPCYSLN